MTFKNFIKYFITMPIIIVIMIFEIISFFILSFIFLFILFFMWSSCDSDKAQQGFWLCYLDLVVFIINESYDSFLEIFYKSYYKANQDFLWELRVNPAYDKYRTFHKSLTNLNVFAYRCKSLFKKRTSGSINEKNQTR